MRQLEGLISFEDSEILNCVARSRVSVWYNERNTMRERNLPSSQLPHPYPNNRDVHPLMHAIYYASGCRLFANRRHSWDRLASREEVWWWKIYLNWDQLWLCAYARPFSLHCLRQDAGDASLHSLFDLISC